MIVLIIAQNVLCCSLNIATFPAQDINQNDREKSSPLIGEGLIGPVKSIMIRTFKVSQESSYKDSIICENEIAGNTIHIYDKKGRMTSTSWLNCEFDTTNSWTYDYNDSLMFKTVNFYDSLFNDVITGVIFVEMNLDGQNVLWKKSDSEGLILREQKHFYNNDHTVRYFIDIQYKSEFKDSIVYFYNSEKQLIREEGYHKDKSLFYYLDIYYDPITRRKIIVDNWYQNQGDYYYKDSLLEYYNDSGQLTIDSLFAQNWPGVYVRRYDYDSLGRQISLIENSLKNLNVWNEYDYSYENDTLGNWTTKCTRLNGSLIKIVKREITYF